MQFSAFRSSQKSSVVAGYDEDFTSGTVCYFHWDLSSDVVKAKAEASTFEAKAA